MVKIVMMQFLLILFLFVTMATAQEYPVLWEDHFDDDDPPALKNVGWFYYTGNDIKGQIIQQQNNELYIQAGSYLDMVGVGAMVTNGLPEVKLDDKGEPTLETLGLLLQDNYSQPNQILDVKLNFYRFSTSSFVLGTRLYVDSMTTGIDPTAAAGYALLITPTEKSIKMGRYDTGIQVMVPASWTYYGEASFDFEIDVYYRLRWFLQDSILKVKIWEGEPEDMPDTWLIEAIDPEPRVRGNFTLFGVLGPAPEPGNGDQIKIDDVVISGFPPTTVLPSTQVTEKFRLQQNFPNPFNPHTQISFSLSQRGLSRLAIYNLQGQLIRTIGDEILPAGTHRYDWDGTNTNGEPVASGIYLYTLQQGEMSISKRMLLLR